MSATTKTTVSPLIGMEIEANFPFSDQLPKAVQEYMLQVSAQELRHGPHASVSLGYSVWCSDHRYRGSFAKNVAANLTSYAATRALPPELQFPLGWYKDTDTSAGMEIKFDGPVRGIEAAIAQMKLAAAWLKNFGFSQFSGAGTHVHIGTVEWLDAKFGQLTEGNVLRRRAEAAMIGYFATRENALYELVPAERRNGNQGYSRPHFLRTSPEAMQTSLIMPGNGNGRGMKLTTATPIAALHNWFMTNKSIGNDITAGLGGASMCQRRKGIPTTEFRIFPGTGEPVALEGYLRLTHRLFLNATKVITKDNLTAIPDTAPSSPLFVKPEQYGLFDLLAEIKDPWLRAWIKATKANGGNPINALNYTAPVIAGAQAIATTS